MRFDKKPYGHILCSQSFALLLKMKIVKNILAVLSLVAAVNAWCQDGSSAYNFLNITSSSRIYGLGGVNITTVDADDVYTADQNPALLGPEMSMNVGFNYMNYVGGSNFAGVRFAHSAGDHAAWSAGIQYFGYGSIKGTDESGNFTGDFSPKDISFSGVYSRDFNDRIRGGFNIKMLYSSYEQYSAWALATDLGINYFNEENGVSLSAVVANLGGQIKRFNDTYDRLPVDVRLGFTKELDNLPLRLSVTAWNLTKWRLPYYDAGDGSSGTGPVLKDSFSSNLFRHLVFAAELVPNDRFHIGIGYNYKTRTDMGTYSRSFLSGLSVEAGLSVSKFGIGIALSQPHTGATTFMLNISTNLYEF